MPLSDTSPEASRIYFQRLAEMTPSERIGIGVALWDAADRLQRAAARRMHPDADDAEITYRIAVARFGVALAGKAYEK
jgi:hypothetical protein